MVQMFEFGPEDSVDEEFVPVDDEEYTEISFTVPVDLLNRIKALDTRYDLNIACSALLLAGLDHLDETGLIS